MSNKHKKAVNPVFYETSLKSTYRDGIKRMRAKFGIPEGGFGSVEEKDKWFDSLGDALLDFIDEGIKLNRDHKLSIMYYPHQEELLFFDNQYADFAHSDLACSHHILNDGGVNRLHIVVNPYASVEGILNYIKSNRDHIKNEIEEMRGDFFKKKYQPRNNTERDERIFEMYEAYKKVNRDKGIYLELVVAREYSIESGEEISMGTVKNIVHDQRKLRK